jgi:hypothetical protein
VQVVGRFVGFDADEARFDHVRGAVEIIERVALDATSNDARHLWRKPLPKRTPIQNMSDAVSGVGTVTDDIAAGIKAVKAGRVEFKMDKAAIIGVGVGKRSFTNAQILENALCVLDAVGKAKPATFKGGVFIKSVTISSSMSPGVRVASSEFSKY